MVHGEEIGWFVHEKIPMSHAATLRVEDLSAFFVDVDDASHLVLRLLPATSLGSLALCSKRFAVHCERFSASREVRARSWPQVAHTSLVN